MTLILYVLIGWVLCGILGYGISLAYSQKEFPELAKIDYTDDLIKAVYVGISGPIGLLVKLIKGRAKHGLKFI